MNFMPFPPAATEVKPLKSDHVKSTKAVFEERWFDEDYNMRISHVVCLIMVLNEGWSFKKVVPQSQMVILYRHSNFHCPGVLYQGEHSILQSSITDSASIIAIQLL